MQAKTKIKIINELDIEIINDSLSEDEKSASFLICECMNCHWRFIGDCNREGYGYTSEGVQTPNFCPMCGKEIDDEIDERDVDLSDSDVKKIMQEIKSIPTTPELDAKISDLFKRKCGNHVHEINLHEED